MRLPGRELTTAFWFLPPVTYKPCPEPSLPAGVETYRLLSETAAMGLLVSLAPFFASFMAKLPDSMPVLPSLPERTWALVATSRLRGLMESLMALTAAGCFFLGWIPGPNTPLEVLLSHPVPSSIPAHSPWLVCLFLSGNVGTPCTVLFWNFLCPLSWRSCPGPAVIPSVTCLSP